MTSSLRAVSGLQYTSFLVRTTGMKWWQYNRAFIAIVIANPGDDKNEQYNATWDRMHTGQHCTVEYLYNYVQELCKSYELSKQMAYVRQDCQYTKSSDVFYWLNCYTQVQLGRYSVLLPTYINKLDRFINRSERFGFSLFPDDTIHQWIIRRRRWITI